jgi:hypothetical protein
LYEKVIWQCCITSIVMCFLSVMFLSCYSCISFLLSCRLGLKPRLGVGKGLAGSCGLGDALGEQEPELAIQMVWAQGVKKVGSGSQNTIGLPLSTTEPGASRMVGVCQERTKYF